MRTSFGSLLLFFLVPVAVYGQDRYRILSQEDAPISILEYQAQIWGTGAETGDGVMHDIRFRNASDRAIVAVKFGVLCYDIFNEFQNESEVLHRKDMLPGESSRVSRLAMPPEAEAFFTGVVFVQRVRFLDGEVWVADPGEVDALVVEVEDGLWNPPGGR